MTDSGYQCDRYYQNQTYLINVSGWEGIPQTTIINTITFPLLLLLFIILRRYAWDFGRAAQVAKGTASNINNSGGRWTSLFYRGTSPSIADPFEDQTGVQNVELRRERGVFSWLLVFWRLTDEQIRARCGSDAVEYLVFERYLIAYSVCILILSMGVIYPLNYTADNKIDPSHFSRTTIMSVQSENPILWVHVIFAFLYAAMAFVFMKRFSYDAMRLSAKAESAHESATRTLMIRNVRLQRTPIVATAPVVDTSISSTSGGNADTNETEESDVELATRRAVMQYFRDCYPLSRIIDVQFAHDVGRLNAVNRQREATLESLLIAEAALARTNICEEDTESHAQLITQADRPLMHPFACSAFWCCCCTSCARCSRSCCSTCCSEHSSSCCVQVDAIEYYRAAVARLTERWIAERERARRRVIPIAFVTFSSHTQAAEVYADFRMSCCSLSTPRLHSAMSRAVGVLDWEIRFAPTPDNVYWENLATRVGVYRLRYVLVNVCVFLLTFFLTTPSIIIQKYNSIQSASDAVQSHPLLVQFVPTVILWTSAVLLPVLVSFSETLIGHWTKTGEHHATMHKCYIFLLLMVLVLPSVGLPSAEALIDYVINGGNYRYLWQCVFVASNGAFFVSYMIMSALLGNGLELLRIADLIVYVFRMCATRSSAEKTTVRKRVCFEFQFGVNYAWLLAMSSILVAYSIPVPLITPCGVIYMLIKYNVDKYNLIYAYLPSRIDRKIHRTAINYFLFGALFLQLNLVIFMATRFGTTASPQKLLSVVSLIALLVSVAVFFVHARGWLHAYSRFANTTLGVHPAPTDNVRSAGDEQQRRVADGAGHDETSHNSADSPLLEHNSPVIANALQRRSPEESQSTNQEQVDENYVSSLLHRRPDSAPKTSRLSASSITEVASVASADVEPLALSPASDVAALQIQA